MIRNFVGILFLVGSGFLMSLVIFLGFTDTSNIASGKWALVSEACIPFLIPHLIGLALYRERHWGITSGVTFIAATVMSLFMVVNIITVQRSPELAKVMDTSRLDAFSDYATGFTLMAIFAATGILFFLRGRSADLAARRESLERDWA